MRSALYARVSTERQEREQTIESQLEALRSWAEREGHEVLPEHIYIDKGYSGSRLDRPALDRLRDALSQAQVELLIILSPDRLARRYAYQVLLLEEFRRVGCQVIFLQHPISDDPNDQLLLQIQGAIAEYERALLSERFRRGKLQKARSGIYHNGRPPYGYDYLPKQEGQPGSLVINQTEAGVVKLLYQWLIEEHMTVRQILKRLNAGPWTARSGKRTWSNAVIHHILADPVYIGRAYANRYMWVEVPSGSRRTGYETRRVRRQRPEEEWIAIAVPAIIDETTYQRAQSQLARNAQLSYRNNTKYNYLLRCLLTCGSCGFAMHGRTRQGPGERPPRQSYECGGKDCIMRGTEQACPRRPIPAAPLEEVVWGHVNCYKIRRSS